MGIHGAGSSRSPIVISDDEDAAIVELELQSGLSDLYDPEDVEENVQGFSRFTGERQATRRSPSPIVYLLDDDDDANANAEVKHGRPSQGPSGSVSGKKRKWGEEYLTNEQGHDHRRRRTEMQESVRESSGAAHILGDSGDRAGYHMSDVLWGNSSQNGPSAGPSHYGDRHETDHQDPSILTAFPKDMDSQQAKKRAQRPLTGGVFVGPQDGKGARRRKRKNQERVEADTRRKASTSKTPYLAGRKDEAEMMPPPPTPAARDTPSSEIGQHRTHSRKLSVASLPPKPMNAAPLEAPPPSYMATSMNRRLVAVPTSLPPALPPPHPPPSNLQYIPPPITRSPLPPIIPPSFPPHVPPESRLPPRPRASLPVATATAPLPLPPPTAILPITSTSSPTLLTLLDNPPAPAASGPTRQPSSAAPKKIIGMPLESDPQSKHGVYTTLPSTESSPDPRRTLVMELLPKKFRTLPFVQNWSKNLSPNSPSPLYDPEACRTDLDVKSGKALIEFPSAEFARLAWGSPRLPVGDGKEHIRVWWYREEGVVAAGELEEGEIDEFDVPRVGRRPSKGKSKEKAQDKDSNKLKLAEASGSESVSQVVSRPTEALLADNTVDLMDLTKVDSSPMFPDHNFMPPSSSPIPAVQSAFGLVPPVYSPASLFQPSMLPVPPVLAFGSWGPMQMANVPSLTITHFDQFAEESMDLGSDEDVNTEWAGAQELSPGGALAHDQHSIASSRETSPVGSNQANGKSLEDEGRGRLYSGAPILSSNSVPSSSSMLTQPFAPPTGLDAHFLTIPRCDSPLPFSPALSPSHGMHSPSPLGSMSEVPSLSTSVTSTPASSLPPLSPQAPLTKASVPDGKEPSQAKLSLLARKKELEERIAKGRKEIAARDAGTSETSSSSTNLAVPSSGNATPRGLTEERLRRLVLESKRKRAESTASGSGSTDYSLTKEVQTRVEALAALPQSGSTGPGHTFLSPLSSSGLNSPPVEPQVTNSSSSSTSIITVPVDDVSTPETSDMTSHIVSFEALAESFISESISTVTSASPSSTASPVPSVFQHPLPPKPLPNPALLTSEKSILAEKQKLLERNIAESKNLMQQLASAKFKEEKEKIKNEMAESKRLFDEGMNHLKTLEAKLKEREQKTASSLLTVGAFSTRRFKWPQTNMEQCVLELTDNESEDGDDMELIEEDSDSE